MKAPTRATLLALAVSWGAIGTATANTAPAAPSAETAPGTSSATVETTLGQTSSSWTLSGSAALLVGSTDNATLLNVPTSGNYMKISPTLNFNDPVSETLYVDTTLNGNLKRYSDPGVNSLAGESSGNAYLDAAWTLNDSWEVGSNLSFAYMQNHIPVVGTNSVSAIDQRYVEPDTRIYGAWTGDRWGFELGGGYSTRRYQTTTYDIEDNIYHNTYNSMKFDGRSTYRWSKNLKFELKSTFEQRDYTERMAEYSEGLPIVPGSGSNPLLTTFAQEYELTANIKGGLGSYTPSFSIRSEKDQVFGARDSLELKARQKASIRLTRKLSFEPEISVARQGFSNFRSDPINDPQNSPLRVDWNKEAVATLKWALSKTIVTQAGYSFAQKQTNYTFEEYTEQSLETGMNMEF